jgi:hypothetical protein
MWLSGLGFQAEETASAKVPRQAGSKQVAGAQSQQGAGRVIGGGSEKV